MRDDRPFAGPAAPAGAFFYSPDRGGVHPGAHLATYTGLMQADAYAGFNRLYEAGRKPGPIVEAVCWAHARRKFFVSGASAPFSRWLDICGGGSVDGSGSGVQAARCK